ncbi:MAG: HlyD family secretion protein [Lysinibacillus sp.]
MVINKKFKIFGFILAVLVVINAYLVLKNNDVIQKSYYINDIQYAAGKVHTKELEKEGILATSNDIRLAAPVQSIEEVLVKRGDSVSVQQELAIYKSDAVEKEQQKLEIERNAYESELAELENILSDLSMASGSSGPSTATDSTTLGSSGLWNIDLTLEFGIDQNTPTAEGEAIIRRHIAETERQLEIVDAMMTELITDQALASPVEGVVGEVVQDGDTITFIIYAADKSIVTYIDEAQWQRVEPQQRAEVVIRAGKDDEMVIEGTVIEKQEVPAEESLWYEEMAKHEKLDSSKTLYEVQIQPFDLLVDTPFGEKVDVTITTDEVFDSLIVRNDWIVDYEVPDVGNTHIYTIGYDGKTRLVPVEVAFKKKGTVDEGIAEEEPPAEEPVEEEEVVDESTEEEKTIYTVDFKQKEEEEDAEEELYDVTVFTGAIEDGTILLDGTPRNIYAPTFRPYPLERYKWENVGEVTWRDIVKFIMQP